MNKPEQLSEEDRKAIEQAYFFENPPIGKGRPFISPEWIKAAEWGIKHARADSLKQTQIDYYENKCEQLIRNDMASAERIKELEAKVERLSNYHQEYHD